MSSICAVNIKVCPICYGTGMSRYALNRCYICRGIGLITIKTNRKRKWYEFWKRS